MTFVVAQAEALEEEPTRTNYVFQPTAVSNELALEDRATHLEVVRQASRATRLLRWQQTLELRVRCASPRQPSICQLMEQPHFV